MYVFEMTAKHKQSPIVDTKTLLMSAAIRLIWSSTYHNVGVAEICAEAGVTKGGFYHYFDTKADLFYEASHFYWESMKHRLDEVFSADKSSQEQLEALINFIIKKQEENTSHGMHPVSGCPIFMAGGQAGTGDEKVKLAARELASKAIDYNMNLVKQLMADGLIEDGQDALQSGRMLYQYVMGLLMYGRVVQDLDVVKSDLRKGIYRIVILKKEYQAIL
jgi:TetR/AcrR family transcriptional repressor of nem operon